MPAPSGSRPQPNTPKTRINRQIRMSPLRVIDTDGTQLGVIELQDALSRAEAKNLDLVEVAPNARPPVARIMDYGKFKFEQQKQARVARKNQHVVSHKEAKFRPQIGEHDYDVRVRHMREWLEEGHKIRVIVQFRGRQITHPEFGHALAARILEAIQDIGKPETMPRLEGKLITFTIVPGAAKKA